MALTSMFSEQLMGFFLDGLLPFRVIDAIAIYPELLGGESEVVALQDGVAKALGYKACAVEKFMTIAAIELIIALPCFA
jgi:hypothetical protein